MFLNRFATRIVAVLLFVFGGVLAAQTSIIAADDRYNGYRGIKIEWPSGPPDLARCKAGEYYEPSATNLVSFAVNVARVRIQEYDECTWMITTTHWRYVLRRAGTRVAVDVQGRDLYDFGRGDGKVCKNPRPVSIPYKPAPPPPPARITIQKELLLANGVWATTLPTFTFDLTGTETQEVQNGVGGQVTVTVKPGCYNVTEQQSDGYELVNVVPSDGRVCVGAGEHKAVLFKNRQMPPSPVAPPPPPPPAHVHAVCEGFNGIPDQPMVAGTVAFKVTPVFRGEVTELEWMQEGTEGTLMASAISVDPAVLEHGAETRFRVTGKDSNDHVVTCSFVVTVVVPAKNPGRPGWSKVPILNCGYQLIPGLGGFTRHGAGDIVEKGLCLAAAGATAWYFWPAIELFKPRPHIPQPRP